MFHRILVPLDGSSRAEQALPVAARLARTSGATLTVLRVVTTSIDIDMHPVQLSGHVGLSLDAEVAQANEYLAQVASSDDLKGIDIRTEALSGTPASIILLFAKLQHVDLIVMCSHGFTGFKRWWLGNVAQHVARHSTAPVLVLHEGFPMPTALYEEIPRPVRVLVALDGSSLAETALAPAAFLSATLSAPAHGALHLVRVLPLRELEEENLDEMTLAARRQAEADVAAPLNTVKQRLREGDLARLNLTATSSVVVHSDVAHTLIHVAEHGEFFEDREGSPGCDVIAMSTHGRSGPQRWVLGSITERMLGATRLPLLIVRSHSP
jgi:nucleotide-binding universal stress UspA family protein